MWNFCVNVVLACGFGALPCVNIIRGNYSHTTYLIPLILLHLTSLISHRHLTPLISFISHATYHIHKHLTLLISLISYNTHLPPLISHHSALTTHLPPSYTTHLPPLISHHATLTTHLPPSYTTHLLHLTPFVSHHPSHTLAISHHSSHTTHLTPIISR